MKQLGSGGYRHSASQATNFSSLVSADRPIDVLEDDRLRRGDFAKNIARILQEWRGRDSLVIAVYGVWGTGKTSLKNLILRSLADASKGSGASTEILQFNPWEWVGHSELTAAFFAEVAKTVGRPPRDNTAIRAAQVLRAYASSLAVARAVLEGLPRIVVNIGLLVGAMGFGASVSRGLSEIGPVVGAILFGALTIAAILGHSESILQKLSARVSARLEANAKTIAERKKELADILRGLDRNILVIIDDIDRLAPAEIRTVFQLVKANADFPNFVYFLPFQRDLVAKALDEHSFNTGDQFLEKIIQIGFDIPSVSQADVDNVLEEKLNILFTAEMSGNTFSNERWINLYHGGLRHYFPDLRCVNRFASSLAFHVELLRKDRILEVNPIDLTAIEALRLFEPKTYHHLRAAKELFFGPSFRLESNKSQVKEQIVSIYADASSPGHVAQVFRVLFPNLGFAFDAMTYDLGQHPEWTGNLQICTVEFYDRYFQLTIPETDISQAEATELVQMSGSATLFDRFRSYGKQGQLMAVLDRFEGNIERVPPETYSRLIRTLLEIGEELPEAEPGFFSIGPEWTVQRIVKKLLDREPDKRHRTEILKEAISEAEGLSIAVSRIGIELKALAEKKLDQMLFAESDILSLRDLCVAKIRTLAKSGKLASQRELAHVLFRWAEWTNDDEVKAWVSALISTAEGALVLLKRFTQRSTSTTGGASIRITWFIRLSNLERFANISTLTERANAIIVPGDDVEAQRALSAFREALGRRAKGKSEDDVWDD